MTRSICNCMPRRMWSMRQCLALDAEGTAALLCMHKCCRPESLARSWYIEQHTSASKGLFDSGSNWGAIEWGLPFGCCHF